MSHGRGWFNSAWLLGIRLAVRHFCVTEVGAARGACVIEARVLAMVMEVLDPGSFSSHPQHHGLGRAGGSLASSVGGVRSVQ